MDRSILTAASAPEDIARVAPPRWLRPGLVVLIAAVLLTAAALVLTKLRRPPPALPVLGAVPALSMHDQRGRPVTDQSFRDAVTIVDFFFTSCPSSCPRLTGRMAELGRDLSRRRAARVPIRLASITVDPETDTPARLAEYARRYHADDDRWWFLTGEAEQLTRVVVDGFKVNYQKADPSTGIYEIMHGNWFLLVDAAGRIRGYYLSDEPDRLRDLVDDAVRLASEPR